MRSSIAMAFIANILLATYAGPAAAFCVYNDGPKDVTFFAWPVAAQSFKAVVHPGDNACCNWQNPTCFAKDEGSTAKDPLAQCAPVTFYITPQAVDTGKITSAFIEKAVLDVLAPIIGVVGAILAPFTGGASVAASVGITAAAESAGLGVADAVAKTGIPFTADDTFQAAINGGSVTWDGTKSSAGSVPACSGSSGRKMLTTPYHPTLLEDEAAAQ